jgi:hypothetical protein
VRCQKWNLRPEGQGSDNLVPHQGPDLTRIWGSKKRRTCSSSGMIISRGKLKELWENLPQRHFIPSICLFLVYFMFIFIIYLIIALCLHFLLTYIAIVPTVKCLTRFPYTTIFSVALLWAYCSFFFYLFNDNCQ